MHVAADALIAIAYYSIPIFLIYFVRQIEELPFKNIFILKSAFILSCGTTHIVEIWTLWHPDYWLFGILKAITALISLYTAFGAVYLISNSKNLLDAIATWGNTYSDRHFDPKDCWAIRRGNTHQADSHTPGLYCSHFVCSS